MRPAHNINCTEILVINGIIVLDETHDRDPHGFNGILEGEL